jgi:hypothetical protein
MTMPTRWTIAAGEAEYEFKDSRLTSLHREFKQLDVGRCFFSAEAVAWDSDPAWPIFTELVIKRNGVPWFQGKRMIVNHEGRPAREGLDYELVDAMWDIEDVTYLQSRVVLDAGEDPVYVDVSEYIFNQDPYGNKLHTGEMITDVLNWCLYDRQQAGLAVPFQIGTIDADADVPWRADQDRKCIEVIREMHGWHPSFVGWLDHSTTPPTFHYRKPANLRKVTITVPNATQRHEISLRKREDLICEAVIIAYRKTVAFSAGQAIAYEFDKYPGGASQFGRRRVFQTVDLDAGQSASGGAVQEMITQQLRWGYIDWWEQHLPDYDHNKNPLIQISNLRDLQGNAVTINSVIWDNTDAPPATWDNELIGGGVPATTGFTEKKQTFRAIVRCKIWKEAAHNNLLFDDDIQLTIGPISVVNGGSGTGSNYYQIESTLGAEFAEPTPVNLAQKYHEGINGSPWEGAIQITEREVDDDFAGALVNIAGGRAEWENMDATVHSSALDVDAGKTSLQVGFPEHLGIQKLVERQRQSRGRSVAYVFQRMTGEPTSNSQQIPAVPINTLGGETGAKKYKDVVEVEET